MGVATASLITGAAFSGYNIIKSEKDKNEAEKAARELKRQELENPYENIQISTLKSEQQTDANLSNAATSVDALRRGGTREVLGGIPKINENSILLQNQISQDLEAQNRERQMLIARGEENIRAIRENREIGALQGLYNQKDTAIHNQANAFDNLVQTGVGFAELYAGNQTSNQPSNQFQLNNDASLFGTNSYSSTLIG